MSEHSRNLGCPECKSLPVWTNAENSQESLLEDVDTNLLVPFIQSNPEEQTQALVTADSGPVISQGELSTMKKGFPQKQVSQIINLGIMVQAGPNSQVLLPSNTPDIIRELKNARPDSYNVTAGFINDGMMMHQGDVNTYMKSDSKSQKRSSSSILRIQFNIQDPIETFAGRVDVLQQMHEAVQTNMRKASPTVLSQAQAVIGMGGIGKTETTRKYANNYKDFYWHRLWINAETHDEAKRCFLHVAAQAKVSLMDIKGNEKQMNYILEEIYDILCTELCLIVFDNANAMEDTEEDGIRPYLPKSVKVGWKHPAILITSRNPKWDMIPVIKLGQLDESECFELLRSELMFPDTAANRSWAKEITMLCEGLPLVVKLVIAVIREVSGRQPQGNTCTLETFLEEFRRELEKPVRTPLAHSNISPNVFNIFGIAFRRLASEHNGPLAMKCLDVMSLLKPDGIPINLLHTLLAPEVPKKVEEALRLLDRHNFIATDKGVCTIHRVIQYVKLTATPTPQEPSNSTNPEMREIVIATFSDLLDKLPANENFLKTENLSQILENGVTLARNIFRNPSGTEGWRFVERLSKRLDYYFNNRRLESNQVSSNYAVSQSIIKEGVRFNVENPIDTFTGREIVLNQLNTVLSKFMSSGKSYDGKWKDTGDAIVSLIGFSGLGKSEAVRKYVQLYGKSFKHCLWLNAETEPHVRGCFLQIASIIHVPILDSSQNKRPFSTILQEIYQVLFMGTCLMVFDNASKINVDAFFPRFSISGSKFPCVIVTRHAIDSDFWLHYNFWLRTSGPKIDIESSDPQLFEKFLLQELQLNESKENRGYAKYIATACQQLPVVLQLMVALIKEENKNRREPMTLKEFTSEIWGSNVKVGCQTEFQFFWIHREIFKHILRLIEVKKNGKLALDCLKIMAMLSTNKIPNRLLLHLLELKSEKLFEVLNLLEAFKLIRRYDDVCTIQRKIQQLQLWEFGWTLHYGGFANASLFPKVPQSFWEFLPSLSLRFTKILEEIKENDSRSNLVFENGIQFSDRIRDVVRGPSTFWSSHSIPSGIIRCDFLESLIKKLFLSGRYPEAANECEKLCYVLNKID